jgi:hypothetical protein
LGIVKDEFPPLELSIKVCNINKGHNEVILQKCQKLNGYSTFIAKIREYQAELGGGRESLAEAITQAIKFCITHDILKDFLELHSREAINMLLTGWSWEDVLEVQTEEAREEGLEKGLEEGQNMVLELLEQGYTSAEIKSKLSKIKTKDTPIL